MNDEGARQGAPAQNHSDAPNDTTVFDVARPPQVIISIPLEGKPQLRIKSWGNDRAGAEARIREWINSKEELREIVVGAQRLGERKGTA
jgi:hypothetical protein